MNSNPKVSVVIPCYNHEKFIACAIDSVLAQTYTDYELIVCDNGCTDNSTSIINSYGDRIRIIRFEQNNPMKCVYTLFEQARGEYVAMLCSDDYWYPDKLLKQMEAIETNPDCQIFFTWALMVDESMQGVISDEVFMTPNRSRAQWINKLISRGTCLEYSSLLVKNDGRFQRIYNRDNRYRQLPDLNLYLNIVCEQDIYVVEEVLVKHRMHGNNMSRPSMDVGVRTINEQAHIIYDTWKKMTDEDFVAGFLNDVEVELDQVDIMCQRMIKFLEIGMKFPAVCNYSFSFFWDHYNDEGVKDRLEKKYRFSIEDFYQLEGKYGVGQLIMDIQGLVENRKETGKGSLTKEERDTIYSILSCNKKIIEMKDNGNAREALIEAAEESMCALEQIGQAGLNQYLEVQSDTVQKGMQYVQCQKNDKWNIQNWDNLIQTLVEINKSIEKKIEVIS